MLTRIAHRAMLSSDSWTDQRMAHALTVEFGDGIVNALVQIIGDGKGLMGQLMTLQITPNSLDIIEFGGVFGSRSMLSQCARPARAAMIAALVWIGPLLRPNTRGLLTMHGLAGLALRPGLLRRPIARPPRLWPTCLRRPCRHEIRRSTQTCRLWRIAA